MACRSCGDGVAHAKAPAHVVPGGLPSEALLADILGEKYADHLPLYRQAQMMARQGVTIDRATLAGWVGRAAGYLKPIVDRQKAELLKSDRLFVDQTTAKVLAPGRRKTKDRKSSTMGKRVCTRVGHGCVTNLNNKKNSKR